MLTTPFLFIALRAAARITRATRHERAPDAIDESNPVIVAGFGRFGQVVVRVLRGLGIDATLIDHDPGQIETVRRFGFKAYYGDATRMDLLEAAGAARARLLLVAIDDPGAAMQTVRRVRQPLPAAPDRGTRAQPQRRLRVRRDGHPAVREVFGSALDAAGRALRRARLLGERGRAASCSASANTTRRRFAQAAPHRNDLKTLIELQQRGRRDIERLLAAEIHQRDAGGDEQRGGREVRAERL